MKHQRTNAVVQPKFPFECDRQTSERECDSPSRIGELADEPFQSVFCEELRKSHVGVLARQRLDRADR